MVILEAYTIEYFIQDRLLLDIEHVRIHKKDRIGLVGKNGSGKTTLMEVLSKKISPEKGSVTHHALSELLPQLKRSGTTKSGGEITQDYIVQALLKNPALLLADEPTTNLDKEHIEWLEKKMQALEGALVVVSHDRAFLDALCTEIWELEEGKLKVYKGNYSAYKKQKEAEEKAHQAAYENIERKRRELEEALKEKEKKAARATHKPKNVSPSEASITGAKPYFAKKQKKLHKTVTAIETRLDKLEKIEKRKELPALKMDLPNEEMFKGRVIIRVEDSVGKVENRRLWAKTSFMIRGGEKIALLGANGSGKTTFIKKLIQRDSSFKVSPSVKIGYFSQHLQILDLEKTILENVKETSRQTETFIRTVLARMLFFRDDVYKKVKVLSGGERVKVALAKLFLSDVNTLVLDEPTNFLDLEALEALESLLVEYGGSVLFASHDRRFIEHVATRLLVIEEEKMHVFEGSYAEYKKRGLQVAERNVEEEDTLVLETKISEILGRLSIEPSEKLEQEFEELIKRKNTRK